MNTQLREWVETISLATPPRIIAQLAHLLQKKHTNVQAIIAYGSALRDSNPADTLIDYYVLTKSSSDVSSSWLSARFCKVIPPNVYYCEENVDGIRCRAKYAALPLSLLQQKVQGDCANPYFWARFAQPMRLVWWADEAAKQSVLEIMTTAMTTAAAHAKALAPNATPLEQWSALFRKTYTTELRPEDQSRAQLIVDMQRSHFETVSQYGLPIEISPVSWASRKWQGKLLSLLRLAKAAFTFQGGVDYAAWKIKRHSGVEVEVKDWHRRHPFIASLVFLPALLRRGGLK